MFDLFAFANKQAALAATTCDKINLKWNSILEEHMIEKCTVVVHGMAQNMGPIS